MLVSWQFSGPYGVTKLGSGWRKDVVNQWLEFGSVTVESQQEIQSRWELTSQAARGSRDRVCPFTQAGGDQ